MKLPAAAGGLTSQTLCQCPEGHRLDSCRDIPRFACLLLLRLVFEAQILIIAARRLGFGLVSVPVETRYHCADSAEQFRKSHFRLFRDLYNITAHVLLQALAHGRLVDSYRGARARPPVIFDPGAPADAAAPLPEHAQGVR